MCGDEAALRWKSPFSALSISGVARSCAKNRWGRLVQPGRPGLSIFALSGKLRPQVEVAYQLHRDMRGNRFRRLSGVIHYCSPGSLSDWRNGKAGGRNPQRTERQICSTYRKLINTFIENVLKLIWLVKKFSATVCRSPPESPPARRQETNKKRCRGSECLT